MPFTYYSPHTVNSGQVPSAQSNFTRKIVVADNRLRTIANGGNVANGSGFDIRPYDAIGGAAMTFKLVQYDATTGFLEMDVLVPTENVGTAVYLYYGDATLSSDASSTSAYDSTHKLVWHANQASSPLSDSTSSGINGTQHDGVTFQATGKAGFAVSFDGTDDYIDGNGLSLTADLTVSFWFKGTTFNDTERFLDLAQASARGLNVGLGSPGFVGVDDTGGPTTSITGSGLNDGNWHSLVVTRSGTTYELFIDNSSIGTSGGTAPTYTRIFIGTLSELRTTDFSEVVIDEVIVESAARATSWLTTRYNNQNAPGTYATLGDQSNARRLILSSPLA